MSSAVNTLFGANEALRSRVAAACRTEEITTLFNDVAEYIFKTRPSDQPTSSKKRPHDEHDGANVKKIKTENDDEAAPQEGSASLSWTTDGQTSFKASDISFLVPVRKKMQLELVGTAEDGNDGGIRGVNPATRQFEVGMSYSDIDQVILVPIPEKPTPQFNFILIPNASSPCEPIVFTVPSKRPKNVSFREPSENDTYELYLERAINSALASTSRQVIAPCSNEFESKSQSARRKGERLWHVKAHRGSKEGYLYFLETGILWGFKKPVVFLGSEKCKSVSYTSVLQRTFNMVVTINAEGGEGDKEEEIEFGMIDQVDFEGIDAYVKRHGLNDASLAESRRAKKYNVNAPVARGDVGEIGAVEGEQGGGSEMDAEALEKALQDAEDEEEEDYEISGGESEGSGSDSEGDGDGDDGGGGGGDGGEEEEEEEDYGDEDDDL